MLDRMDIPVEQQEEMYRELSERDTFVPPVDTCTPLTSTQTARSNAYSTTGEAFDGQEVQTYQSTYKDAVEWKKVDISRVGEDMTANAIQCAEGLMITLQDIMNKSSTSKSAGKRVIRYRTFISVQQLKTLCSGFLSGMMCVSLMENVLQAFVKGEDYVQCKTGSALTSNANKVIPFDAWVKFVDLRIQECNIDKYKPF